MHIVAEIGWTPDKEMGKLGSVQLLTPRLSLVPLLLAAPLSASPAFGQAASEEAASSDTVPVVDAEAASSDAAATTAEPEAMRRPY